MKLSKEAIEGMEIEYVDISPLPLLNTDLIVGGKFPPAVEAFGQQILKADGVLFATAENNFSVSGILSFASSFVWLCLVVEKIKETVNCYKSNGIFKNSCEIETQLFGPPCIFIKIFPLLHCESAPLFGINSPKCMGR